MSQITENEYQRHFKRRTWASHNLEGGFVLSHLPLYANYIYLLYILNVMLN